MYGELWARLKARRSCEHRWVFVNKYETTDLEGDPYVGFRARRLHISTYRCELCGKKQRRREWPQARGL